MSIRFECRCGKKMKAPDDKIGMKVLCSACGSPVSVPEADTAAVATVAAGASDMASDLLRGTGNKEKGKKPRAHFAFDDGSPNEVLGYDAAATLIQFVRGAAPLLLVLAIVVPALYFLSSMFMMGSVERPDLGFVSGRITLDGEPLAGAAIEFRPQAGSQAGSEKAASSGRTDEEGNYTLIYVHDVEGAILGEHSIVIRAPSREGVRLPNRYNVQSELVREVKPGNNTLDFKLNTDVRDWDFR